MSLYLADAAFRTWRQHHSEHSPDPVGSDDGFLMVWGAARDQGQQKGCGSDPRNTRSWRGQAR